MTANDMYKKDQIERLFSTCPLKKRDLYINLKDKMAPVRDDGYNQAVKELFKWRDSLY